MSRHFHQLLFILHYKKPKKTYNTRIYSHREYANCNYYESHLQSCPAFHISRPSSWFYWSETWAKQEIANNTNTQGLTTTELLYTLFHCDWMDLQFLIYHIFFRDSHIQDGWSNFAEFFDFRNYCLTIFKMLKKKQLIPQGDKEIVPEEIYNALFFALTIMGRLNQIESFYLHCSLNIVIKICHDNLCTKKFTNIQTIVVGKDNLNKKVLLCLPNQNIGKEIQNLLLKLVKGLPIKKYLNCTNINTNHQIETIRDSTFENNINSLPFKFHVSDEAIFRLFQQDPLQFPQIHQSQSAWYICLDQFTGYAGDPRPSGLETVCFGFIICNEKKEKNREQKNQEQKEEKKEDNNTKKRFIRISIQGYESMIDHWYHYASNIPKMIFVRGIKYYLSSRCDTYNPFNAHNPFKGKGIGKFVHNKYFDLEIVKRICTFL